ncbi:MAG: hypothetical protein P8X74_03090 [Reinekea sp.]
MTYSRSLSNSPRYANSSPCQIPSRYGIPVSKPWWHLTQLGSQIEIKLLHSASTEESRIQVCLTISTTPRIQHCWGHFFE